MNPERKRIRRRVRPEFTAPVARTVLDMLDRTGPRTELEARRCRMARAQLQEVLTLLDRHAVVCIKCGAPVRHGDTVLQQAGVMWHDRCA